MVFTDFTQLDDSSKNYILSVVIGSEVVIESLLDTAYRHLYALESISAETFNAKLYYECSVRILTEAYNALIYINFHSMDSLTNEFTSPLNFHLETIASRLAVAKNRFKDIE